MRFHHVLSLTLSAALAAAASAQTPQPAPRPTQTPGQTTPTQPVQPTQPQAQPTPVQPGQPLQGQTKPPQPATEPTRPDPFPAPLYQMNDVAQQLNLNEKQTSQLNAMTNKTQTRYRESFEKLGSLADAERGPRVQELNRQYANDWSKGARDIMNEKQMSRYQQLYYQYGGFNALADPTVQNRLNLTAAQQRSLNDSVTWSATQMRDINRLGATDRDRGVQAYRDYQKEYQTRLGKFLTPDQLKTWQQMTGDPYAFQPSFSAPAPSR